MMCVFSKYLERLKIDELYQLAEFVVKENFNHHVNKKERSMDYLDEVSSVFEEESLYFEKSKIFILKDSYNSLVASIRVLKWDYENKLPIQKIFGINPLSLKDSNREDVIWHIGRFAIKKGTEDINLFKRMMVCAIAPVCDNKRSIVFAECDFKLLRVMLSLGIKAVPVGRSIDYLGSETIPIKMNYDGLIDFYNRNKFLISADILEGELTISEFENRLINISTF